MGLLEGIVLNTESPLLQKDSICTFVSVMFSINFPISYNVVFLMLIYEGKRKNTSFNNERIMKFHQIT